MSAPGRPVLVATLGLAPQVLTETLYALAMRAEDRFVPEEIHIITTLPGRARAMADLLDGPHPMLKTLAADYGLPQLGSALTPERIRVITGKDGAPLADIGSEADNTAAADCILALIRDLTADPETALHVSIAGGRKTMGFLLGYALSLYGRPQDRLSHVLVDAPLETHPQFYYPRPEPETLTDRDGLAFVADASRVSLADIPFVRLRRQLPGWLLDTATSYGEAVEATDERFRPPAMMIDVAQGIMVCHGIRVPVGDAELAFAAMLALRRIEGAAHGGALRHAEFEAREYLDIYMLTARPLERTIEALRDNAAHEDDPDRLDRFANWFSMRISHLNTRLGKALGPVAPVYALQRTGPRGYSRVGFDLPPEAIRVRGVPWATSMT